MTALSNEVKIARVARGRNSRTEQSERPVPLLANWTATAKQPDRRSCILI